LDQSPQTLHIIQVSFSGKEIIERAHEECRKTGSVPKNSFSPKPIEREGKKVNYQVEIDLPPGRGEESQATEEFCHVEQKRCSKPILDAFSQKREESPKKNVFVL